MDVLKYRIAIFYDFFDNGDGRWDKMFLNVMTVFWISNGHIAIFSNAALTSETVFSQYFYANILNIKWLIADFHQSFDSVIQNI